MSGKDCDADDWLQCNRCCHWFHGTYVEECAIVDGMVWYSKCGFI